MFSVPLSHSSRPSVRVDQEQGDLGDCWIPVVMGSHTMMPVAITTL